MACKHFLTEASDAWEAVGMESGGVGQRHGKDIMYSHYDTQPRRSHDWTSSLVGGIVGLRDIAGKNTEGEDFSCVQNKTGSSTL